MAAVEVERYEYDRSWQFLCPDIFGQAASLLDHDGKPERVFNSDDAKKVFAALQRAPVISLY